MKNKVSKEKLKDTGKAGFCIFAGTTIGILTYQIFLFLNIAIFGWNFGLVVAPLVAGYVETYLAEKLLNESIGAISAFILFIVTVVYGFIIANPTLGFNIITVGSAIIIVQAALPTLINYILIVVVLGMISYFLGIFKKITNYCYYHLKKFYYSRIVKKPIPIKVFPKTFYNEHRNFVKLNNRQFYFLTTSTTSEEKIEEYMGLYVGSGAFEKRTKIISTNHKKEEKDLLDKLKIAKYNALNNLADSIERDGGNGVIDLKIEYELVDQTKGRFQVIAHGTAVKISQK